MGKQICFYEKNFLDLDNENATVTSSQADDFVKFVRNRRLDSAWMTTGSVDADEPYIDFDLGAPFLTDRILLVDHNFKSYKIETYDPDTGLWTSIYDTTTETQSTTELTFSEFYGQRMKLTVRGTQVVDAEKKLTRLIISKSLGRFSYWPKIDNLTIDQGKTARTVLSGKRSLFRTVGALSCRISLDRWRNASDLALIEALHRQVQGFEVWLSGGDEEQFYYATEGYRKKDIYLMGISSDFKPKLAGGIYVNGYDLSIDLVEVVR